MPLTLDLASLLAGFALSFVVSSLLFRVRLSRARRDALSRARATLRGQASEQLAPLCEGFRYDAADARFLGAPVDYLVFDGLADDDADVEVVFLEVKTGRARLSERERRVRDAIEAGRVRFETLRM